MKYLKALLINIIICIIIITLSSTLSYFNTISDTTNNILKIISIVISTFTSGIYIGLKSQNKGYIEGMKVGGLILFVMLFSSYIIFKNSIDITKIVYYVLIFMLTVIGSIIGINKRKEKN